MKKIGINCLNFPPIFLHLTFILLGVFFRLNKHDTWHLIKRNNWWLTIYELIDYTDIVNLDIHIRGDINE